MVVPTILWRNRKAQKDTSVKQHYGKARQDKEYDAVIVINRCVGQDLNRIKFLTQKNLSTKEAESSDI